MVTSAATTTSAATVHGCLPPPDKSTVATNGVDQPHARGQQDLARAPSQHLHDGLADVHAGLPRVRERRRLGDLESDEQAHQHQRQAGEEPAVSPAGRFVPCSSLHSSSSDVANTMSKTMH
jgi:hypothetical protein